LATRTKIELTKVGYSTKCISMQKLITATNTLVSSKTTSRFVCRYCSAW